METEYAVVSFFLQRVKTVQLDCSACAGALTYFNNNRLLKLHCNTTYCRKITGQETCRWHNRNQHNFEGLYIIEMDDAFLKTFSDAFLAKYSKSNRVKDTIVRNWISSGSRCIVIGKSEGHKAKVASRVNNFVCQALGKKTGGNSSTGRRLYETINTLHDTPLGLNIYCIDLSSDTEHVPLAEVSLQLIHQHIYGCLPMTNVRVG